MSTFKNRHKNVTLDKEMLPMFWPDFTLGRKIKKFSIYVFPIFSFTKLLNYFVFACYCAVFVFSSFAHFNRRHFPSAYHLTQNTVPLLGFWFTLSQSVFVRTFGLLGCYC